MPFQVLRSTELLSTPITGYLQGLPLHCRLHTHIIIIMVLSNLSVSDVSIYLVWFTQLLVVLDELYHLWRAISCCRLNRSPQVSHLNGSFARSATVILLLTVPHCGISLLCRFKSCGRLNCFTYIHTFPSGVVHISDTEVTRERTGVVRQCIGTTPSAGL